MELVPHRFLLLNDNQAAIIAENSNAWAVIDNKDDYIKIKSALSKKVSLPEKVEKSLYDSGLLVKDNSVTSLAIKKILKTPRSLLLKLTGACNIFCEYCYDYDRARWKSNLNFERIKDTVDTLLETNNNIGVVFHGGEPLLRFDLIEEVVNYLNQKQGKTIRFSIQTNASLLDKSIVEFLEVNNFSVGLSIDGHTESANRLRKTKGKKSALEYFIDCFENFPHFVRNRCGVLSVVSKSNIKELPNFALWLQDNKINSLGLSFMDKAGKGVFIPEEKVTFTDAIELFEEFCLLIEEGKIKDINLTALTSRISNLYQYHAKDFCHKGPCAASDEFIVLDAEGNYRTCDSTYHSFFEIGNNLYGEKESEARQNIFSRHAWLKNESLTCSKCPIISFCGGTCAAKAIAANSDPYSIDVVECAISKYLYPRLLNEFAGNGDKPLLKYYESFQ